MPINMTEGAYITGKNIKLEANDNLPGLPLNLPFLTVHVVHRCHTDTWKKRRKKNDKRRRLHANSEPYS